MRNALSLLTLCHFLSLAPTAALALGFGRVDSGTVLGQRLNFTTQLSVEPQDALTEACVSAEVTAGDSRVPPEQVRISLSGAANGTVKTLRVTTTGVIDEPIVQLNIGVGCVSRISRRFTVFADPPVLDVARPEPPPPPLVATTPSPSGMSSTPAARDPSGPLLPNESLPREVRGYADTPIAATTPTRREATRRSADVARPRTPTAPRAAARNDVAVARPAPRPRSEAVRPAPTSSTRPARPVAPPPASARAASAAAPVAVATGPRLQLGPDETVIGGRPGPTVAASAPVAASAATVPASASAAAPVTPVAAGAEAGSAVARAPLDDEVNRLRTQNQALQRSVGALESRLRDLEGSRGRDPWWLALALLAGLLALIGVAMLWRRVQGGERRSWWNPSALAPSETASAASTVAPPVSAFKPSEMGDGVVDEGAEDDRDDDRDAGPGTTRGFAMTLPGEPVTALSAGVSAPPRGALSVEELFDLEQQADFFLALGQDDAAIDLLLGHARDSGASSPMPYLKLVDIYRRRDDREGFEATRKRFNQRFNAHIGTWDEPADDGARLDDSPALLAPLQAAWARPADVVRQIEAQVWQTDPPRAPIDLHAYRDLLFLYTIARDLLDHPDAAESAGSVDVVLPLLEGPSGGSHVAQLMSSTIPMRVQEEHGRSLDRAIVPDVDLSQPASASAPAPLQAAVPAPGPRPARPDFTLGSDFIQLDPEPPPKA